MALHKGMKIDRGYATVDADGVNYREISETLTDIGFPMNHSSARNYVLRAMRKFAVGFASHLDRKLTSEEVDTIALSPEFQSAIGDILSRVEISRREEKGSPSK